MARVLHGGERRRDASLSDPFVGFFDCHLLVLSDRDLPRGGFRRRLLRRSGRDPRSLGGRPRPHPRQSRSRLDDGSGRPRLPDAGRVPASRGRSGPLQEFDQRRPEEHRRLRHRDLHVLPSRLRPHVRAVAGRLVGRGAVRLEPSGRLGSDLLRLPARILRHGGDHRVGRGRRAHAFLGLPDHHRLHLGDRLPGVRPLGLGQPSDQRQPHLSQRSGLHRFRGFDGRAFHRRLDLAGRRPRHRAAHRALQGERRAGHHQRPFAGPGHRRRDHPVGRLGRLQRRLDHRRNPGFFPHRFQHHAGRRIRRRRGDADGTLLGQPVPARPLDQRRPRRAGRHHRRMRCGGLVGRGVHRPFRGRPRGVRGPCDGTLAQVGRRHRGGARSRRLRCLGNADGWCPGHARQARRRQPYRAGHGPARGHRGRVRLGLLRLPGLFSICSTA